MADVEARASDHLANERTFLAWLRTALAMISLGIALSKFAGYVEDKATTDEATRILGDIGPKILGPPALGVGFVSFGVLCTLGAAIFYVQRSKAISEARFRIGQSHWWVWGITGIVMILGAIGVYWVAI